jgi:hypothetical protein
MRFLCAKPGCDSILWIRGDFVVLDGLTERGWSWRLKPTGGTDPGDGRPGEVFCPSHTPRPAAPQCPASCSLQPGITLKCGLPAAHDGLHAHSGRGAVADDDFRRAATAIYAVTWRAVQ